MNFAGRLRAKPFTLMFYNMANAYAQNEKYDIATEIRVLPNFARLRFKAI